jgi:hypothetical protein
LNGRSATGKMPTMSEANGTTVTLTLNDGDAAALRDLTRRTGRSSEDLLGEAVHRFLAPPTAGDWPAAVRRAAGIWKDRHDLPSPADLRGEWERRVMEAG